MPHGNIKRRILSILESWLISRKLKDKRVVTDFRHLNMRIAKEQFGISIGQGHIFCVRKFIM